MPPPNIVFIIHPIDDIAGYMETLYANCKESPQVFRLVGRPVNLFLHTLKWRYRTESMIVPTGDKINRDPETWRSVGVSPVLRPA